MSTLSDIDEALGPDDLKLVAYLAEYLDRSMIFSSLMIVGLLLILTAVTLLVEGLSNVAAVFVFAYSGTLLSYTAFALRRRYKRRLDRMLGKTGVTRQPRDYNTALLRETEMRLVQATDRLRDLESEVSRLRKQLERPDPKMRQSRAQSDLG